MMHSIGMTKMTPSQELHQHGFVKIKTELGPTFARLNDIIESRLKEDISIQAPHLSAFGSLATLRDFPELMSHVVDPRLLQVVNSVAAGRSAYFQRVVVFAKPGNNLPTPWHQDCPFWNDPAAYHECHYMALLCYLKPTSQEGGALRVIPGSHLSDHPLHHFHHNNPEERSIMRNKLRMGEFPDHPLASDHPEQVAVPVAEGDIIAMDARLLHGAYPNKLNANRNLVTFWFFLGFKDLLPGTQRRLARETHRLFEGLPIDSRLSAMLPPHSEEGEELPEHRIPNLQLSSESA